MEGTSFEAFAVRLNNGYVAPRFVPPIALDYGKLAILRLEMVFDRHSNDLGIDFISLDVEGYEREVLIVNGWQALLSNSEQVFLSIFILCHLYCCQNLFMIGGIHPSAYIPSATAKIEQKPIDPSRDKQQGQVDRPKSQVPSIVRVEAVEKAAI